MNYIIIIIIIIITFLLAVVTCAGGGLFGERANERCKSAKLSLLHSPHGFAAHLGTRETKPPTTQPIAVAVAESTMTFVHCNITVTYRHFQITLRKSYLRLS